MPVVAGCFVSNSCETKLLRRIGYAKKRWLLKKMVFGREITTKFLLLAFSEKSFVTCFSILEKLQVFRSHNLKYYVFPSGMFLKQL